MKNYSQEIEALRAEVAGIRAGPGSQKLINIVAVVMKSDIEKLFALGGRGHTGSLPRGGVLEPQVR